MACSGETNKVIAEALIEDIVAKPIDGLRRINIIADEILDPAIEAINDVFALENSSSLTLEEMVELIDQLNHAALELNVMAISLRNLVLGRGH
jgi:hypothetical protein